MTEGVNMLGIPYSERAGAGNVGWRRDEAVSQADFLGRTRQWQWLLSRTPGLRIAFFFEDSIEFAAALCAAWHCGKTVYLPADTLPATCASLQPLVDAYAGDFPPACAPLRAAPDAPAADCGWQRLDPDFVGLVVFTSGSTGAPQAIAKKLSQLAAEVATLETLFGADGGSAEVVATVSHQHIYGLLFKVLWPLAGARSIHAYSQSYPEQLAQLTTTRDCILVSSPAHLKRLPESPSWTAAAHRVRLCFSSGGPLPLEVAHANAGILGAAPVEVYGSSETGGIGWRRRDPGRDDGWSPMPGVQLREDVDGLLAIRSPHLPDDGWFSGADRGQLCADGRFLLQGRADRIVKIEEKRISLDLIEATLMQSPLVAQAKVIVLAHGRQRIAAFVVPSDAGRTQLAAHGKPALNLALRDVLAGVVERIALPRIWRYPDALPVNRQGKTTHAELIALLDDEQTGARRLQPHMELLDKDAQRVLLELVAPRDLIYFDGHFPQAPILPGVAQVEWALQLARAHFSPPAPLRAIHALKFQQVIRPDAAFNLELLHDPAKNSIAFKYFSSGVVHASGRLMFGAEHV
jgi:acyl-CoA synthetase (AMP-forming)/AMP-acid ligase II/3-hydroxymyristoyl/3-hydroxydecanoyl-(acyl carrier protein) dehydratase